MLSDLTYFTSLLAHSRIHSQSMAAVLLLNKIIEHFDSTNTGLHILKSKQLIRVNEYKDNIEFIFKNTILFEITSCIISLLFPDAFQLIFMDLQNQLFDEFYTFDSQNSIPQLLYIVFLNKKLEELQITNCKLEYKIQIKSTLPNHCFIIKETRDTIYITDFCEHNGKQYIYATNTQIECECFHNKYLPELCDSDMFFLCPYNKILYGNLCIAEKHLISSYIYK